MTTRGRVALTAFIASLLTVTLPAAPLPAQDTPVWPDSAREAGPASPGVAPPGHGPRVRVPAAPARGGAFRASDFVWVGVFASGLLLVEPAETAEIALTRAVRTNQGSGFDTFASVGEVAGHGIMAYGLAAGTLLIGTLGDEPVVARIGLRSLESLALATAATASLKFALGRERPLYSPHDSDEFRPFEQPLGRSSFPSGHTAHLFALATTLSHELSDEAGWVPWVAYPIAGLVGASRVVGQKHWVTDVISGAAVGVLAARTVDRFHQGSASGGVASVSPLFVPLEDGAFVVGVSVRLP